MSTPSQRTPAQLLASIEALLQKRITEMAPHLHEHERRDAAQSARAEAWVAAQRYEPTYGTRFTSYVLPFLTGGIATYLRGETRQTKVAQHLGHAGMTRLAEEPDDFDLFHDTDEQLKGKLDELVQRQLAATALGLATAPADPESTLAEEQDRRIAAEILARGEAEATSAQRALVALWYREGRPLREVVEATGRSERSLRRDHDELLDGFHHKLVAAGITAPPREK